MLSRQIFVLITRYEWGEIGMVLGVQVFGMSFRFGYFAGRVLGSSKIDSEDRVVF